MAKETRGEKVRRIVNGMHRDMGMVPEAVTEHYNFYEFAVELDPEWFEARPKTGDWGFFKDKPRYLDPITREVIGCVLLAFRNTPGCCHHTGTSRGTLLTNITKRFAASSNRDIIVLCHDKRDWMLLGRFIM